ncbi:MAG: hypothetical protein ABJC66_15435 [Gammaproteobacteria bacterium]
MGAPTVVFVTVTLTNLVDLIVGVSSITFNAWPQAAAWGAGAGGS